MNAIPQDVSRNGTVSVPMADTVSADLNSYGWDSS